MKFNRSFIYILVLSATAITSNAQAQADEYVELQFVSYPPVVEHTPVELLIGPEEVTEVELPTATLSKAYRVKRMSQWVLGKQDVGADGKPRFTSYGQTAAGSSAKQIILVIPKGKKYPDGFEMTALDGSQNGFKAGQFLFFNACKVDIAGQIGDLKFKLEPGNQTILAPKPNEIKNGKGRLHVYAFFRKGDEAAPFYTAEWPQSLKARFFVFFYHDPATKKIRIHDIRNYPN